MLVPLLAVCHLLLQHVPKKLKLKWVRRLRGDGSLGYSLMLCIPLYGRSRVNIYHIQRHMCWMGRKRTSSASSKTCNILQPITNENDNTPRARSFSSWAFQNPCRSQASPAMWHVHSVTESTKNRIQQIHFLHPTPEGHCTSRCQNTAMKETWHLPYLSLTGRELSHDMPWYLAKEKQQPFWSALPWTFSGGFTTTFTKLCRFTSSLQTSKGSKAGSFNGGIGGRRHVSIRFFQYAYYAACSRRRSVLQAFSKACQELIHSQHVSQASYYWLNQNDSPVENSGNKEGHLGMIPLPNHHSSDVTVISL